jgi:F-type H+-transporting ATPase subunit a
MESIGDRLIWYYIPFTNIEIPMGGVNILTVFNSLLVILILLAFARYAVKSPSMNPGRLQYVMELYVGAFDNLVCSSLELETREKNRRFFALIGALFSFLLLANFMGFFPTEYFTEPTADINTTMAYGLMGFVIATWCGVKVKGGWGYFSELLGPMWSQEGAKGGAVIAGKLSALFFFPLNVIGELAKIISISFRIFGNILGGGIIIIVVSNLVYHFSWLALGLDMFFIFFVGMVQAFVFTMLTLTYISVAIK